MSSSRLDGRYGGHREMLLSFVTALCVACGGSHAQAPAADGPATQGSSTGDTVPPPAARPEPKVEPFELAVANATLSGELRVPGTAGPHPVVLIVAGSGPTDRDGNSIVGLKTDAYKLLAEELEKHDVATLRFDKRGVGKSTLAKAPGGVVVTDFSADVEALVVALKKDARFRDVTVLGHSEGALLALLAQPKAQASALVLVNAPGRPLAVVLREQLQSKVDEATLKAFDKALVALRRGQAKIDVPPALAPLFAPAVRAFLKSIVDLDPVPLVAKTQAPVTVLSGDKDAQVPAVDGDKLAAARPGVRRTVIAGMNHVWKVEATASLPQASYADPSRPLAPGFVDAVVAALPAAVPAAAPKR